MTGAERWLVVRRRPATVGLRLFCFPYAGGSASSFYEWPASLPSDVELNAAQLPGREDRMMEPPVGDCMALVRALTAAIQPLTESAPFVFFGHSLGAVLAFEVARRLGRHQLPQPSALVVSGCRGPRNVIKDEPIYALPEPEFIDKLKEFKATPEEVLDHPELMALVLPRLRADFTAIGRYQYRPGPPLQCSIVAFGGADDPHVERDELLAWRRETRGGFNRRIFDGDHFFIQTAQAEVLAHLTEVLQAVRSLPWPGPSAGDG